MSTNFPADHPTLAPPVDVSKISQRPALGGLHNETTLIDQIDKGFAMGHVVTSVEPHTPDLGIRRNR